METRKITVLQKLFILTFVFSALISQNVSAQYETENFITDKQVKFRSEILNEDRVLLISLPDGFNDSDKKFPVLYVLDGRVHFQQASGVVDYLSRQGLSPEMIVVAIANIDRNRDFTPKQFDRMPTSGGGEKFHDFIKKELMPFMGSSYKASGYNILAGHSLGGLFAAYSFLEFPGVFDSYISISPYLQIEEGYTADLTEKKLKDEYEKPLNFYMTIGDEPGYFETLEKFSGMLEERSNKGINFKYVKLDGEDHRTTPYLTLFYGLRFIFEDWTLPKTVIAKGIDAVDEHFAKLSKKYGYKIETSENTINRIGYNYLQEKDYDKAIDVFKENVKRFSASANVYDSLGEAYEKSGKIDLAVKNYQKAYDLAIEQDHRFKEIYEKNLNRAKESAAK